MVTEGGWTVATLKEYIERRFDEADRIALARFETQKMAADKAVDVAKQTADKLSEYNREVLTRSEYEIAHSVLNDRLGNHEYLAGEYSIADIATYPWVARYEWHKTDLNDFPGVKRWFDRISARPAVQRGMAVPKV